MFKTFFLKGFILRITLLLNLQLWNGINEYGTHIISVCSFFTPWSHVVNNALFVRFKTDGSIELRGFRLHWTITVSLRTIII